MEASRGRAVVGSERDHRTRRSSARSGPRSPRPRDRPRCRGLAGSARRRANGRRVARRAATPMPRSAWGETFAHHCPVPGARPEDYLQRWLNLDGAWVLVGIRMRGTDTAHPFVDLLARSEPIPLERALEAAQTAYARFGPRRGRVRGAATRPRPRSRWPWTRPTWPLRSSASSTRQAVSPSSSPSPTWTTPWLRGAHLRRMDGSATVDGRPRRARASRPARDRAPRRERMVDPGRDRASRSRRHLAPDRPGVDRARDDRGGRGCPLRGSGMGGSRPACRGGPTRASHRALRHHRRRQSPLTARRDGRRSPGRGSVVVARSALSRVSERGQALEQLEPDAGAEAEHRRRRGGECAIVAGISRRRDDRRAPASAPPRCVHARDDAPAPPSPRSAPRRDGDSAPG